MKKEGRLHLRISPKLLGPIKNIAKRDGMTLTQIVESAFKQILEADEENRRCQEAASLDAEQI